MLIYAIDDEPNLLYLLHEAITEAAPEAEIADFSDREYVKYYLYDIVHFGTLGWTDANEAVYEFAMKEN